LHDKRILFVEHHLDFVGRVDEDVGVDTGRAKVGHGLKARDKRLAGLFDHEQIQVAFGIGVAASRRAEEDDLLRMIAFKCVEQRGK
jgi:hypothetical protein